MEIPEVENRLRAAYAATEDMRFTSEPIESTLSPGPDRVDRESRRRRLLLLAPIAASVAVVGAVGIVLVLRPVHPANPGPGGASTTSDSSVPTQVVNPPVPDATPTLRGSAGPALCLLPSASAVPRSMSTLPTCPPDLVP
ncbi:MAG: hypothetical protein QOE30_405 [Mycobacterium sp.]|nr:hypothetical protein [Mycobacterium sp.]